MTPTSAPLCHHPEPLSALLEKAAGLISEIGAPFTHYGRKLTDLDRRFSEGRFHLAVLGQFKRGKSTLLNALTGEPILPVGVVPLTAAPTFIQFGQSPKITVQYQDGRPEDAFSGTSTEQRCAYLAGFVTEAGNPKNRRGIATVQVELPAPLLSEGLVLIDTPGIGSTYRHNTAATINFLQQCDAALFLVSADPPITEVELEFLNEVQKKVPRLFFVLNKIDYLDGRELEEALSFYKSVLVAKTDWNEAQPVFCVSARKGMEARAADDSGKWAGSGMAQLESFLVDFLAKEKRMALADAISGRAMDIIESALMEAGIALQALQLPQQDLEEKITSFESSLKRAESERRMIHDILEGDKKRVAAFVEDQASQMREEAEQFLKDIMNRTAGSRKYGKSTKVGIQEAWAEAIPAFFGNQQEAFNQSIQARLLECLTPHEQRLAQLVETLRHTAADLFQVPYRPSSSEAALEIKRKPYWVLNAWNTDALPILKSMETRLDDLVRRNVGNMRWSMLQNLNISFARFSSRIQQRLAETVEGTHGAIEAASKRRQSGGQSVAAEISRMNHCISAMQGVKTQMEAFRKEQDHLPPCAGNGLENQAGCAREAFRLKAVRL